MLKCGIALVISNYEYDDININNLPSCKKDGQDMDNVLQNLGFDTLVANNLNREELLEQIVEFIELLPLYQVALCYYSGHGLQIDGKNYVVPSDAKFVNNKAILINMSLVEVDLIVDGFKENSQNTNLLILDACRTNPFLSKGFAPKGLAEINAGAGTLISYATSPNDVSIGYNSEEINSLFTKHFIKNIVKPNLRIEEIFKLTRIDVETETDGNQIPWESTSLKQDFFFIKEDNEIINNNIYKAISNFKDNGKVLIKLSEKYSFTITEIYLRYYHYKMNLPGGIYLGDTEIYGLALKNVLENGFYYKNYRWYYKGKPVKMGEFLHRVPSTDNKPLVVMI
ncbi:MAG: caspase domain-containing protein, partial [Sedimentibacter sp.]